MITAIKHKGLRLLWEKDDQSKLPPEQVGKIRRILSALNTAKTLEPIKAIPGYKLHLLNPHSEGIWSVWVTGNYRIVFRFHEGEAYDIDYTDYH